MRKLISCCLNFLKNGIIWYLKVDREWYIRNIHEEKRTRFSLVQVNDGSNMNA